MKILWLCNIVLPDIADSLGVKASNKEGWLSGVCDEVKSKHDFELGICFPVPMESDGFRAEKEGIKYFGFYEDTLHSECYDSALECRLQRILDEFDPDAVHVFGTEYPHTLAMARCMKAKKDALLIGVQGVMDIYTEHFLDGVPERVIRRVTFRDFVRRDSLTKQRDKFGKRAVFEDEAAKITGNITGRTPFDLDFSVRKNPNAKYYFMNETLRRDFYDGRWSEEGAEVHSVFLSQGNYPIKGLHYMLEALPRILEAYPDTHVYVAGDVITRHRSIKDKLKLSSYGKYILELQKKLRLDGKVTFLGNLDSTGIKERLLKSNVFVCPSTIENSPNSLGEAMILGVPCIAANVGGIPGIFKDGVDGLMFERGDVTGLSDAVIKMFSDDGTRQRTTENAYMHAHITHNPDINYKRLLDIYREITECR